MGGEPAVRAATEVTGEPWALGHTLQRLRGQIDLLEADFARALAGFCHARLYEKDGFPDAVSWLKDRCRMSPGAAAERVLVAEQLPRLPQAQVALARGEIGYQSAAIIARSASQLMPDDAGKLEERTMAAAGDLDPGKFREFARAVVAEVDHEAIVRDAARAHSRRRLSLWLDGDGCTVIDGLLDPEAGARLRVALEAFMTAPLRGDDRTPAQRRADALSDLVGQQMRAIGTEHQAAGARPQVTVITPLSALLGDGGVPLILQGSIPLSQPTLRRLACDANISGVVTDDDGSPIFGGRDSRTFTSSQRRALVARDRGCVFPGCGRPAAWCDGHHLVHRAEGGPTTLANGCLLCAFHHRCVHEGGWKIARSPGGGWVATPPFPSTSRAGPPNQ